MRANASTFLRWASDRGLIVANPLAGYRAPRATRAERLAQSGRILSDAEIAAVWRACGTEAVNPVFGAFVRFMLLTGQRRTETAQMLLSQLDENWAWWAIPPDLTKNGLSHEVPVPIAARQLIQTSPHLDGCAYVFSTNGVSPMSGWSKLMQKLRAAAGLEQNWGLHDLRRTFRSGLTRLGIEADVAEIMLNHRPETLRSIYDREPRFEARREAKNRLEGLPRPDPAHLRKVPKPQEAGGKKTKAYWESVWERPQEDYRQFRKNYSPDMARKMVMQLWDEKGFVNPKTGSPFDERSFRRRLNDGACGIG